MKCVLRLLTLASATQPIVQFAMASLALVSLSANGDEVDTVHVSARMHVGAASFVDLAPVHSDSRSSGTVHRSDPNTAFVGHSLGAHSMGNHATGSILAAANFAGPTDGSYGTFNGSQSLSVNLTTSNSDINNLAFAAYPSGISYVNVPYIVPHDGTLYLNYSVRNFDGAQITFTPIFDLTIPRGGIVGGIEAIPVTAGQSVSPSLGGGIIGQFKEVTRGEGFSDSGRASMTVSWSFNTVPGADYFHPILWLPGIPPPDDVPMEPPLFFGTVNLWASEDSIGHSQFVYTALSMNGGTIQSASDLSSLGSLSLDPLVAAVDFNPSALNFSVVDSNFASFTIPAPLPNGDDMFEVSFAGYTVPLLVGDELNFLDYVVGGVSEFQLSGIDDLSSFDFVTGLKFTDPGVVEVFVSSVAGTTAAVPEPNALIVALIACASLVLIGRSRSLARRDHVP